MVFCGHCGYQLAPGDTVCPRCGAEVPTDLTIPEPAANNPTEISQVVHDVAPMLRDSPQGRSSAIPGPQPLILRTNGTSAGNEHVANEATTLMSAPTYQQPQPYQPPQPSYASYPSQAAMSMHGYNAGGQAYYPAGQSAVIAQLLESSRKGKTVALLLILFGLLFLIVAIIVFLLNQQGIIFSS